MGNTLQRTIAIIRPNAAERKGAILKTIEENGFVVVMQKDMEFSKEKAEELYSRHKDEEFYESLIVNMTAGPSTVLCLAKSNAVHVWKEMLTHKETESAADGTENIDDGNVSLQAQFSSPGDTCEPLHAADSIEQFEREMGILFPMENAVLVIQPDIVADGSSRDIISKLRHEGFNVVAEKEITLTRDQTCLLYKEDTDKDFFEELVQFMSSGPSLVLILSCEDAMRRLQDILGPTHPGKAKEMDPNSIRALYGKDVVKNAVHGSATKQNVADIIKDIFPDVIVSDNGLVIDSCTKVDDAVVPSTGEDCTQIESSGLTEETVEVNETGDMGTTDVDQEPANAVETGSGEAADDSQASTEVGEGATGEMSAETTDTNEDNTGTNATE